MAPNGNGHERDAERRPATFEEVLDSELAHFGLGDPRRPYTGAECGDEDLACDSPYAADVVADAHDARLSGLALSGGGIRSATFNLGVLQALAKLDLLEELDYLSTVSGGGYIGSWLAAWIEREERRRSECAPAAGSTGGGSQDRTALGTVSAKLVSAAGKDKADELRGAVQPDPPPIQHLREYSNYLTPRRGLWSTDTWTLGATYIRNLFLTLSVLVGTVVTLVLLGQAFAAGFYQLAEGVAATATGDDGQTNKTLIGGSFYPFIALIAIASAFLGAELSVRRARSARHAGLAYGAVALTLASTVAGTLWLLSWPATPEVTDVVIVFVWLVVATVVSGFIGRWLGNGVLWGSVIAEEEAKSWDELLWLVVGTVLALVVLGALWWRAALWLNAGVAVLSGLDLVVWGVPLFVLMYSITAAVSVGFAGGAFREVEREWLARFFAALAKATVLYTVFLAFVVYASGLVDALPRAIEAGLGAARGEDVDVGAKGVWGTLGALWAVLSSVGAYLASGEPSKPAGWRQWVRRAVVAIAPFVFIAGLLILVVWGTTHVVEALAANVDFLNQLADVQRAGGGARESILQVASYWRLALALGLVMALVTLIWSARVGVNDFSMHALYGNRLVRAYLGASNLDRRAHPFTGFDQGDNSVRMADLARRKGRGNGPYPIINAAVNLVSSRRLAWQKRKAASYTFTPQFCGYEYCDDEEDGNAKRRVRTGGYVKSRSYGGGQGKGVSLGKAMTISGAAASPNMGYRSSPTLTFLMTMFNVRLGWWLPNTAKRNTNLLRVPGPRIGLIYLVAEALGLTNVKREYVYLSDGGHFDNLGLYELIRRRCHFVIVSDAEADPQLRFNGLGNAIEKCRTDLGVPIDIDVSQIRRDAQTDLSRWYCAVGCIRYSDADPGQHDGTLIYIKATLTGDEPQDVATYAQAHASFPHESTADQWFDESQFESYRALGHHVGLRVLANAVEMARHRHGMEEHRLQRIFLELRKQWYPPAAGGPAAPGDLDRQLEHLLETLRTDPKLAFLDSQLYPNLQRVADGYGESGWSAFFHRAPRTEKPQPPKDPEELRAGFYYCKELMLLMERVFQERRLDTEYGAPNNRGWMNLFRRWALARLFRFTWAMTAGTYSARFQSFCEHHLRLDSGEPRYGDGICLRVTVRGDTTNPDVDIVGRPCEGTEDDTFDWTARAGEAGIHLYERWLIEEFITAYVYSRDIDTLRPTVDFEVRPLRLSVDNVLDGDDNDEMSLNAGFVVIGPAPKDPHRHRGVVYFRIRSSMRNMDLARKAFIEMRRALPHIESICLAEELPVVEHDEHETGILQWRAYREIHAVDRENLERCRWFSRLVDNALVGEGKRPDRR